MLIKKMVMSSTFTRKKVTPTPTPTPTPPPTPTAAAKFHQLQLQHQRQHQHQCQRYSALCHRHLSANASTPPTAPVLALSPGSNSVQENQPQLLKRSFGQRPIANIVFASAPALLPLGLVGVLRDLTLSLVKEK